jgi:hypothetical protein
MSISKEVEKLLGDESARSKPAPAPITIQNSFVLIDLRQGVSESLGDVGIPCSDGNVRPFRRSDR